jgi:hypothetical protein
MAWMKRSLAVLLLVQRPIEQRFIASVPGSEVVFDHAEPLANYPEVRRAYLAGVAARTAALGEPWISYFDPLAGSIEFPWTPVDMGKRADTQAAEGNPHGIVKNPRICCVS